MLHLDPERLAALADNEPTAAEASHLAACTACAGERSSYRELVAAAGRMRLECGEGERPVLSDWSTLATQLREEGRLREPGGEAGVGGGGGGEGRNERRRSGWLRAAAAGLLVAAGAAGGYWGAVANGDTAGMAASRGTVDSTFQSVADARATLDRAQRQYLLAASYLAEQHDDSAGSGDADVYRARLAALDAMAGAARAAIYDAPSDPLINQYYLTAEAARQVTLTQLGRTLPRGTQLTSF